MSRIQRGIGVAIATAALTVSGVTSAHAVTSQTNFNSIVPRFQQSHYWEYQNKTTSMTSHVFFTSIGGGYTMNVKAQNGATGVQYAETKGIYTNIEMYIQNLTPVGAATRLIVTNNVWTLADVSVTGWFTTN